MSAQDQETAEAERLAAVAPQINAGHIPDGVTDADPRWAGHRRPGSNPR